MAHSPQFLKLVNEAKKQVKETNVADVKRRMDSGEKFLLVDVREDNEWEKGHVPGAVTQMWSRWMAVGKAGWRQGCRQRRTRRCAA